MARKTIMTAALAATMVAAVLPAGAMAQDYYGQDRQQYAQYQDRHGNGNHARDDHRGWQGDNGYGRQDRRYAYRNYRYNQGYGRGYRQYGHQDYHNRDHGQQGYDNHRHD